MPFELTKKQSLRKIIDAAAQGYQNNFGNESADAKLLEETIKLLVGSEVITSYPNYPTFAFKFIAHMNNVSGYVQSEKNIAWVSYQQQSTTGVNYKTSSVKIPDLSKATSLTQWEQTEFLLIHIHFLLDFYFKKKKDSTYTDEILHKTILLEALLNELWVATNAYTIRMNYHKLCYPVVKTDSLKTLVSDLLESVQQCIPDMEFGDELILPIGFEGHAFYLGLVRLENQLLLRIDNLGMGANPYHKIEKNETSPFLIAAFDLENLAKEPNLKEYLENIFIQRYQPAKLALGVIYDENKTYPRPKLELIYPPLPLQSVDNCTVYNFFIGMRYRLLGLGGTNSFDIFQMLCHAETTFALKKRTDVAHRDTFETILRRRRISEEDRVRIAIVNASAINFTKIALSERDLLQKRIERMQQALINVRANKVLIDAAEKDLHLKLNVLFLKVESPMSGYESLLAEITNETAPGIIAKNWEKNKKSFETESAGIVSLTKDEDTRETANAILKEIKVCYESTTAPTLLELKKEVLEEIYQSFLKEVGELTINQKKITCFICYASENYLNINRVTRLADDLRKVGIKPLVKGADSYTDTARFNENISENKSDFVLVMGDPNLLKQWSSDKGEVVEQLKLIIHRERNDDQAVIKILLEGEERSSFLPAFVTKPFLDFRKPYAYPLKFLQLLEEKLFRESPADLFQKIATIREKFSGYEKAIFKVNSLEDLNKLKETLILKRQGSDLARSNFLGSMSSSSNAPQLVPDLTETSEKKSSFTPL